MPELMLWRTEGQQARPKRLRERYILIIKYRVSQTHRGAAQYKTFSSSDARWTADGRAASWPTAEEGDRSREGARQTPVTSANQHVVKMIKSVFIKPSGARRARTQAC